MFRGAFAYAVLEISAESPARAYKAFWAAQSVKTVGETRHVGATRRQGRRNALSSGPVPALAASGGTFTPGRPGRRHVSPSVWPASAPEALTNLPAK